MILWEKTPVFKSGYYNCRLYLEENIYSKMFNKMLYKKNKNNNNRYLWVGILTIFFSLY